MLDDYGQYFTRLQIQSRLNLIKPPMFLIARILQSEGEVKIKKNYDDFYAPNFERIFYKCFQEYSDKIKQNSL